MTKCPLSTKFVCEHLFNIYIICAWSGRRMCNRPQRPVQWPWNVRQLRSLRVCLQLLSKIQRIFMPIRYYTMDTLHNYILLMHNLHFNTLLKTWDVLAVGVCDEFDIVVTFLVRCLCVRASGFGLSEPQQWDGIVTCKLDETE